MVLNVATSPIFPERVKGQDYHVSLLLHVLKE